LSAEPPVHPAGGSVRRVATRLTGKIFSAAIEGSEGGHGRLLTDIPPVKRPLKNGEDDDSREGNTRGIRAWDIWTRGILVSDKSLFDQRGQGNSFGHDIAGMTNDWICRNPQNAPEMRRWSQSTCTCTILYRWCWFGWSWIGWTGWTVRFGSRHSGRLDVKAGVHLGSVKAPNWGQASLRATWLAPVAQNKAGLLTTRAYTPHSKANVQVGSIWLSSSSRNMQM
jgi:hypothetical protein